MAFGDGAVERVRRWLGVVRRSGAGIGGDDDAAYARLAAAEAELLDA